MRTLPENNALTEGEWWDVNDTRPQVSLEQEYAQEMGLTVGDNMTFDIGGQRINAVVAVCAHCSGRV